MQGKANFKVARDMLIWVVLLGGLVWAKYINAERVDVDLAAEITVASVEVGNN